MSSRATIFVVSTGVSGNLGDAVIRRRVLSWVDGLGPRHVYIGGTSPGWFEQLQLDKADHVYRAEQRREWLKRLLFGKGPRALVYDPGEVPLGREHLKSELIFLVIGIVLRIRGAVVIRPPRAIAHVHPLTRIIHRWACRLSDVVLWRDLESFQSMMCGTLAPDTAFAEPVGPRPVAAGTRARLVISLRGKRPLPSDEWFAAMAAFAHRQGLQITVLSQVDEDEDRTVEVAERLGAAIIRWGDGDGDLAREVERRNVYAEAHTVISDRLHVLLLAAKAGAAPREVVASPVAKVRTHFAVAHIESISLDTDGLTSDAIVDWLEERDQGTTSDLGRLEEAQRELATEVLSMRKRIDDLGRE